MSDDAPGAGQNRKGVRSKPTPEPLSRGYSVAMPRCDYAGPLRQSTFLGSNPLWGMNGSLSSEMPAGRKSP